MRSIRAPCSMLKKATRGERGVGVSDLNRLATSVMSISLVGDFGKSQLMSIWEYVGTRKR
jgi:hypothetical protein